MALDTAALTVMADALKAVAVKVRLHSADPGTGNSNPTTAGDQTVSLTDTSGTLAVSNVAFTGGAANGAVTWVTLWNSAGSTRYGKFQIPTDGSSDLTFNAAGEYTLTALTVANTTS